MKERKDLDYLDSLKCIVILCIVLNHSIQYRAIDEDGKWMPKQKKIYILDKDGNKIHTKKGYKSKTEKTTDWDEPSNAKMWRKNLAELINETNSALKIEEQWEHKSFKELGIDAPPTIHLGSKANALEKKGIHTERADYNRRVLEIRGLIGLDACKLDCWK